MPNTPRSSRSKNSQGEALSPFNPHAAGIDVGAAEIFVSVPPARDPQPVRSFSSFTRDLHAIAQWLTACGVTTVAMESTSVYWIPLYEILEAAGLEVFLVNPRALKNVPGRKSDVCDCQWIQQLHSYGLLRASFRPNEEIVALRSVIRHREMLITYRSAHIQHMQKILHLMNLQLDKVISDITGTTGLQILRAIVAGERDPAVLARFRDPRCKQPPDVIQHSLEGHYKPEHLFQLQHALALYDYYTELLVQCDQELAHAYTTLPVQADLEAIPLPPATQRRARPRKHEPAFDLRTRLYQLCGVDLTAIDGCQAITIQTVLAEIGIDMRPWRTCGHFTSWLGLCPYRDISGGKVLRSRTKKTKNRAKIALRMAAQSLHHSDSALGAFYRRMRARLGAPKAIVATAHKLARIIYTMLKYQKEYRDLGAKHYDARYRERQVNHLKHKAARLGWSLVPVDASQT
jgi:transposase